MEISKREERIIALEKELTSINLQIQLYKSYLQPKKQLL